jgi:cell division protein FtsW (lipid II flippase)
LTLAVLSTALLLLLTAANALAGPAGNTAASGYGGGGNVETEVSGAGGVESGTLPFTGLDLTLIVLGGTSLLVLGYVVRRRGSERAG